MELISPFVVALALVKPFRSRWVLWFHFLCGNMIVETLGQAICEEMPRSLGFFIFFSFSIAVNTLIPESVVKSLDK